MTDTEVVRRLFDELAPEYDQHIPFFATFGKELVAWSALQPGQRVLDIAAGRGAIAVPAAQAVGQHGEVLAIDNAPNMVAVLAADHRTCSQLTCQVMDAQQLDLPGGYFDVVTCGFTLHFLDDPARAIAEAYRVLKAGGRFAFSGPPTDRLEHSDRDQPQPNQPWDFYRDLMHDMAASPSPSRRPDPFTPPPRPLPEMCVDAGFTELEQRSAQASFAMRDPQHHWDWNMSHGFRGFVDSLGPDLATEFRARMFAGLERVHTEVGITVDATVAFNRMRKPR